MKENFLEILGLILAGCLAFLLNPLKKWASKMIDRFWKKEHAFGPEHAEREKRIDELLVELRIDSDADRAYASKFHNGEEFTERDPLWKITTTNETCRPGVAYTIHSARALMVSSVIELIRPLCGSIEASGVGSIDKITLQCAIKCEGRCTVCWYDIDAMKECATKAFAMEHGVRFMMLAPLLGKHGRLVGFVGIDYCSEGDKEEALRNSSKLCQVANSISYLISTDAKQFKKED